MHPCLPAFGFSCSCPTLLQATGQNPGPEIESRVRDRSGYESGRHGCMNADVGATGGSRHSPGLCLRKSIPAFNGFKKNVFAQSP